MKKLNIWISLYLPALILLCCCTDDRDSFNISGNAKDNTVTFSVRVPGSASPSKTKALGEADENEVRTIEILLFDTDGNYTYQPLYSNTITTDPDDSKLKTFTVKVPEGTYNMVVLANARASVAAILGDIAQGDSKASVMDKLLLSNSGKWNSSPAGEGYIPIPMWGQISSITVGSSMPANNPVTLARMLSKIEVALTGPEATGNFSMESIYLYNNYDKGRIAPLDGNWNAAQNVVTAPSVPSSASKPQNPADSPLVYSGNEITSPGISCIGEIYTFEAEAGSNNSLQDNTCLVIGGTYTGDSSPTYYRVDFANTDENGTVSYLSLLRNHRYKVNITKISAPGLPTPEEAFNSRPVNIEADVIEWNDAQISDVVFDGQYMMGVSQGKFSLSREARNIQSEDNTLSVTTDYPTGWKIATIADESGTPITDWLKTNVATGVSGAITDVKLLLTENSTGALRTGYIHLSAGRMTYIVTVDQGITAGPVSLSVTNTDSTPQQIEELLFTSDIDVQPEAQGFILSWTPGDQIVSLSIATVAGNAFSFDESSDKPGLEIVSIADPSGQKQLTIRPTALTSAEIAGNPFFEKISQVTFTVSNGQQQISKTLYLRQRLSQNQIIPIVEEYYVMDGTQKSFIVKSANPFTVTVKEDPNSVITLLTSSGAANTGTGTNVYFNIVDDLTNPVLLSKNVVVTIKSPEGAFPDTDVILKCLSLEIMPESNCYILSPGGHGIYIPVRRANSSDLGNQLGATDSYTAELLWTDNSNRIAPNSNIRILVGTGTGPAGYVRVMPGSGSGNAVVVLKNEAGRILWSWHIWVTDYKPQPAGDNGFMDRNLGALRNAPANVNTMGLLYQWGRKDPFPGSTKVNSASEPVLYDAEFGTLTVTKEPVSASNNLANAVANPLVFYQSSSNSYDWYTNLSSGGQNDNLWGPATKSVYDPCPPGWRVPETNIWTFNNWSSLLNYGRANLSYGGYYPAAGFRSLLGSLSSIGTNGSYWSASPNGADGYSLSFYSGGVSLNLGPRVYGRSVRCVQE